MPTEKPTNQSANTQAPLHTPGPWVHEFREYGGYDMMTSAWDIYAADGTITPRSIATVDLAAYGQSRQNREFRSPQAEADARSIAAAPDLLAALKYLLELGGDDDRRIAAEAAIAKAEGRDYK